MQLTAIEYGLLFELSVNAGRVMTYDRLLQWVWGLRGSGDSRRVRTAAKQLRRKLGDEGPDAIPQCRHPFGDEVGLATTEVALERQSCAFSLVRSENVGRSVLCIVDFVAKLVMNPARTPTPVRLLPTYRRQGQACVFPARMSPPDISSGMFHAEYTRAGPDGELRTVLSTPQSPDLQATVARSLGHPEQLRVRMPPPLEGRLAEIARQPTLS